MLALVNEDFTELYSNLSFKKLAEFSNEDKVKKYHFRIAFYNELKL